MKTIEERANDILHQTTAIDLWDATEVKAMLIRMATEQKAIGDAELAEVKRQRDEYYDEMLKLRRQKVELIEWLNEEASRCRECAKTGYDAYEIGTLEGQYTQAEDTIDKLKAMEE